MKWLLKIPHGRGSWGAKGKVFFPGKEYVVEDDEELVGMALRSGLIVEIIDKKPKTKKTEEAQ